MTFISVIEMLLVILPFIYAVRYPWISAFIRPFYLIIQTRLLRGYVKRYFLVMKDSMPMVLFIIVFIIYFSWMLQRYFSGTLEGVQYFDNFSNSFYNMLVLITTSNFPDIMLPAYQINRFDAIFFIIYLIIGLFLCMNLLLAIFYSNFKQRFEETLGKSEQERSDYLYNKFKELSGNENYLDKYQTYRMFMMIHGLATNTN